MAAVVESPSADEAPAGDAERRSPADPTPVRSQPILVVIALSVAAGAIHAVAMVDHFDHHWLYGAFFLVVTYAQILWAIWIYRHPDDRRALVAGVAGNLAIVAVWVASRTVGMPVGPDVWKPENIGAMDIMATLDQLVLAGVIVAVVAPVTRLGSRLRWLAGAQSVRIGIMLCSASVFSMLLGSHSH
jgi:hypothetical protein